MTKAQEIIKLIESFLVEMEASKTKANSLIINEKYFTLIKKEFPYLIENMRYLSNKYFLRIILTKEDVISVGFCYDYSGQELNLNF